MATDRVSLTASPAVLRQLRERKKILPKVENSSCARVQESDPRILESHWRSYGPPSCEASTRALLRASWPTASLCGMATAKKLIGCQPTGPLLDKSAGFQLQRIRTFSQTDRSITQKMLYLKIYDIAIVYYPVLATVGMSVNLIAIVILSRGKCGLSKCITRYLIGMAMADFMVVVIVIIVEQLNNIYLYAHFLRITPICAVTTIFKVASMDCSVWLTVAFTFDRYIAIGCQKLRESYCTERIATKVIAIVALTSCVRCIPFYFEVEPHKIIDHIPWLCIKTNSYFTSPFWKAHEIFDSIVTPLLPIYLIFLFNILTARHIIAANKVRRGLRSHSENQKDPECENRRKSMILVFTLSTNFILLWSPYVIHSLKWQTVNVTYTDKYLNTPSYILQQCSLMLQLLSTCTNTCIYGLTQRKFRHELKNGVKIVVTLNGLLCK
ncbi:probable G-protein coupled receptor 139 [Narcine bancroftii]|uniref:probable G-protein coupled receptor 139 n=1 Tax=Narcine bancroftii TaxID=1343680 RepID=UPI0038310CA1